MVIPSAWKWHAGEMENYSTILHIDPILRQTFSKGEGIPLSSSWTPRLGRPSLFHKPLSTPPPYSKTWIRPLDRRNCFTCWSQNFDILI